MHKGGRKGRGPQKKVEIPGRKPKIGSWNEIRTNLFLGNAEASLSTDYNAVVSCVKPHADHVGVAYMKVFFKDSNEGGVILRENIWKIFSFIEEHLNLNHRVLVHW